jgi:hypothetical protein
VVAPCGEYPSTNERSPLFCHCSYNTVPSPALLLLARRLKAQHLHGVLLVAIGGLVSSSICPSAEIARVVPAVLARSSHIILRALCLTQTWQIYEFQVSRLSSERGKARPIVLFAQRIDRAKNNHNSAQPPPGHPITTTKYLTTAHSHISQPCNLLFPSLPPEAKFGFWTSVGLLQFLFTPLLVFIIPTSQHHRHPFSVIITSPTRRA